MRCGNWRCQGQMSLQCVHTKSEEHIEAHRLPIFLQCNDCGYTPELEHQPELVKKFLEIFMAENGDMEAIQKMKQPKTRNDDHKILSRPVDWASQENLTRDRKRRLHRIKQSNWQDVPADEEK